MSGRARRRKDLAIVGIGSVAVSSLALAVALLVAAPASAGDSGDPAANYGVVNGTADAATVHIVGASTAFPNYTNGAVDNFYAMAHSHVDNSPFAEGEGSPFDTGPLGQTAAAGNFSQPQYADARYPGSKDSDTETFGNQGGPYSIATASDWKATAQTQEASASSSSAGLALPSGLKSRLKLALATWKAKWLAPLHLNDRVLQSSKTTTLPITVPTVPTITLPGGSSGTPTTTSTSTTSTSTTPSSAPDNAALASQTLATLGSNGLVTSGESSLGTVSLGGGAIVFKKIDVTASITNSGTPKDSISIAIGSASVGGVPVTIDQDGVHVQGQGQNLPYKQADDALNAQLKQAGIQIYTVQPQVVTADNQETLTAGGVDVVFVQPVDQAGVPSQSVQHVLGNVFLDSLASPAPPAPSFSLGGGSSFSAGGGSSSSSGGGSSGSNSGTGFSSTASGGGASYGSGGTSSTYSSAPGSGSAGGTSGSATTPTALVSSLLHKPGWLLAAYLVWQALAIATGASLWRWRSGAVS